MKQEQFRHFRTNFAVFDTPAVTNLTSFTIFFAKYCSQSSTVKLQRSAKSHSRNNKSYRSVLHAHTFRNKIDHMPYSSFTMFALLKDLLTKRRKMKLLSSLFPRESCFVITIYNVHDCRKEYNPVSHFAPFNSWPISERNNSVTLCSSQRLTIDVYTGFLT